MNENCAVGLIPARGGSKSIPLKNIAPLAGRPLISYVITASVRSDVLSGTWCSTDHPDIAEFCTASGIAVIDRPPELGADDTPVTEAILHALHYIEEIRGEMPGIVVLLQPTSPFVTPAHIAECVRVLNQHPDADSAQTVIPVAHNNHAFNQRVIEDGRVMFRFPKERIAAYNKQRKPLHYVFGNLVASRSRSLLSGKDCFGERSVPLVIDRDLALDVDTAEDFALADWLINTGRIKPPRL